MLKKFLEKKTSGFKPIAYLVSKLQLIIVVILFFLLAQNFFSPLILSAFVLIISSYYFYILFFELKKEIKEEEFNYYLVFFSLILVSIDLAYFLPFLTGSYFYSFFIPIVIIFLLFSLGFAFRRKYCFGKVKISSEKETVIEKDFDLLSFTTAGKYIVESEKSISKGKEVKVMVKTTLFGRKPYKIQE